MRTRMPAAENKIDLPRRRPSVFDCFVLAGAAMNLLVIVVLLGFWLRAA